MNAGTTNHDRYSYFDVVCKHHEEIGEISIADLEIWRYLGKNFCSFSKLFFIHRILVATLELELSTKTTVH